MALKLGLNRGGVQPTRPQPPTAEVLSGFEIAKLEVGTIVVVWMNNARHFGSVVEHNLAPGLALVEYQLRSGASRRSWLGRGKLLRAPERAR